MSLKLPDFLCVGAAKSGTTSLHAILSGHPDIFLPEKKEIHFFENNENFSQGKQWYNQYFENVKNQKAIGEITADYMFFHYVPERIINTLGKDVKLIFMLRNPAERAYSEYLFNVRRGYFKGSFKEAIENEKNYSPENFESRYYTHIYRSLYSKHINAMLKVFSNKENIKFILFEEDFVQKKKETFSNLFKFLEIPYYDLDYDQVFKPAYVPKFQLMQNLVYQQGRFKKIIKNFLPSYKIRRKIKDQLLPALNRSNKKVEKLDEDFKKELIEKYFYDDIKLTGQIIGRNLDAWLN